MIKGMNPKPISCTRIIGIKNILYQKKLSGSKIYGIKVLNIIHNFTKLLPFHLVMHPLHPQPLQNNDFILNIALPEPDK